MSEEEKEVLKTFKSGLGLTGAEQEILVNYIDKLQKENKELKEKNTILEGNKIGLKLAIQELKEELDYYKQKENQDFDERDYYEE